MKPCDAMANCPFRLGLETITNDVYCGPLNTRTTFICCLIFIVLSIGVVGIHFASRGSVLKTTNFPAKVLLSDLRPFSTKALTVVLRLSTTSLICCWVLYSLTLAMPSWISILVHCLNLDSSGSRWRWALSHIDYDLRRFSS